MRSGFGMVTTKGVFGTDGNFYGALSSCTVGGNGQVFQMMGSGGTWNENVLYNFTGGSAGSQSWSAPIEGVNGSFYGTNIQGASGCGTIYQLTGTTLTTLYQFDGAHGCGSWGPFVQGTDGSFYGTASGGGNGGAGVVFKITPAGAYTVFITSMAPMADNLWLPSFKGATAIFMGRRSKAETITVTGLYLRSLRKAS
jgi:uncharacterized repeat protein (TIGR03803 family)